MELNIFGLIQLFKNTLVHIGAHENITYAQIIEAEDFLRTQLRVYADIYIKNQENIDNIE